MSENDRIKNPVWKFSEWLSYMDNNSASWGTYHNLARVILVNYELVPKNNDRAKKEAGV